MEHILDLSLAGTMGPVSKVHYLCNVNRMTSQKVSLEGQMSIKGTQLI